MKNCEVCGNPFQPKRKHATTCSARCRKRKSRQSVTSSDVAAAPSGGVTLLPGWVKPGVELVSPDNVGMSRYAVVVETYRDYAIIRTRYSDSVVVNEVMLASEFHPDPDAVPREDYPRAERQILGLPVDFDD